MKEKPLTIQNKSTFVENSYLDGLNIQDGHKKTMKIKRSIDVNNHCAIESSNS